MTRGAWICVDGVEGAGKTTVSRHLATVLPASLASEFSGAPFGSALRTAVRTKPHFISASPIGQSLVFLGDFFELVASAVEPKLCAGETVITDRGYLSKYMYQEVVLERELNETATWRLLDEVFSHLLVPDLTLLLSAPTDILCARLLVRDGHCDRGRQEFIVSAEIAARRRIARGPQIAAVVVDTNRPLDVVLRDVESTVRSHLTGG